MKAHFWMTIALGLLLSLPALADEANQDAGKMKKLEELVLEERAKAEIEKARAEAEKARAEAERAKAEAELARIEAAKARMSLAHQQAEAGATEEQAEPTQGVHTHDGLFMRFTTGPGYGMYRGTGRTITPDGDLITDPSSEGSQAGGSFSLGGAIGENLILHGDIWLSVVSSKKRNEALYQDFATVVLGIGVTYYWMPINFYLTGSIGSANSFLVLHDGEQTGSDRNPSNGLGTGVGLSLQAGKEWWVNDNWALGVALQAEFTYAEDNDNDLIFRHGGAKVLFSATYQ